LFFAGVGKGVLFHLVPLPTVFPDNISAGAFNPDLGVDRLIFGDSIFKTSLDFTLPNF